MEALYPLEDNERPATSIEREELQRILGSFGLYDASKDIVHSTERPEDNKWFLLSEN